MEMFGVLMKYEDICYSYCNWLSWLCAEVICKSVDMPFLNTYGLQKSVLLQTVRVPWRTLQLSGSGWARVVNSSFQHVIVVLLYAVIFLIIIIIIQFFWLMY